MSDYSNGYFSRAANAGGNGFGYASHNSMRKYAAQSYNSPVNYRTNSNKYKIN